MKIGFLGTLRGFTPLQRDAFIDLIKSMDIDEFHHGDCIGSDEQAHDIIRLIAPGCEINIHPPAAELHRAHCEGDVDFMELNYIKRNYEIIDFADIIIACPDEGIDRSRRTGPNNPWRALEYVDDMEKHTFIISKTGEIEERFSGKKKSRYK